MKKNIFAALLAVVMTAAGLHALDEEFMVVTLKDGTIVKYNVDQVDRVEFDIVHTDDAFTVTPEGGPTDAYVTIPSMLRVLPVAAGDPTQFAFGTVEATDAGGLQAGAYGVWLTVSAAKIYNGEVNLAEEKNSYSLTLVKYNPEGDPVVLENVESGTLSTKINNKNNKVTIALTAVFDNGTAITADYTGLPTDVESVAAVIPEKQYGNELYYYDLNGNEQKTTVEGAKKSYSSYTGKTTYRFDLSNEFNNDSYEARLVLDASISDELSDGEEHIIDMAATEGWEFKYGSIQLYNTPDSDSSKPYKNQADNGTLKIKTGDDGSIEVFIDITNSYTNYSGPHTDPQRVILNYVGTVN